MSKSQWWRWELKRTWDCFVFLLIALVRNCDDMVWSRGSRINDPLLALHPQIYYWSDGHWVALWVKVGARFWQGERMRWIIKGQYLQVRLSCTVPIVKKKGNAELAILSSNLVRAMDFMKVVDDYAWSAGINGRFKVKETTLLPCLWVFNELFVSFFGIYADQFDCALSFQVWLNRKYVASSRLHKLSVWYI